MYGYNSQQFRENRSHEAHMNKKMAMPTPARIPRGSLRQSHYKGETIINGIWRDLMWRPKNQKATRMVGHMD